MFKVVCCRIIVWWKGLRKQVTNVGAHIDNHPWFIPSQYPFWPPMHVLWSPFSKMFPTYTYNHPDFPLNIFFFILLLSFAANFSFFPQCFNIVLNKRCLSNIMPPLSAMLSEILGQLSKICMDRNASWFVNSHWMSMSQF